MSKPRYIHDCQKCRFLGTYKNYDLYACGESRIARYSDDGPEYISMPVDVIEAIAKSNDDISADTTILFIAYIRAYAKPNISKLLSLREQAIAKGMKLLSEDEVLEEVKRRRGGD